jgi:5-methylcytosine-specific restriction endonuclease McrA
MTCGYVHTKRAPCPLCACGRTHGKRATVEWSAARRKLLPALLERDPHRCAWCHDETGPLVADHILPLSRFGENHIDNLQILCWSCNSAKGARLQPPRDRKAAS